MKRVILTFLFVVLLCPAAHAVTIYFGGTIIFSAPLYWGVEAGDKFTGQLTYDPSTGVEVADDQYMDVDYSWRIEVGDNYYELLSSEGDRGYVWDDFKNFSYYYESTISSAVFQSNTPGGVIGTCPGCGYDAEFDIHLGEAGSYPHWFQILIPIYDSDCPFFSTWEPGFMGTIEWSTVPEPASIFFLGAGLVGLFGLGRKKQLNL